MPTSSTPTRKRGAQPGNKNARTHGLTPRPTSPEYHLDKLNHVDLTTEIQVLRQQLQRLNEAALDATSLAETVEIARVIAITASALARLIRAQVIVFSADTSESSEEDEVRTTLIQALEEVNRELMQPKSSSAQPHDPDKPPPDPKIRDIDRQILEQYLGAPPSYKKRH